MNAYTTFNQEYNRWLVLEALVKTPGNVENDEMIQTNLVSLGYKISHRAVLEALAWLQEQGFASLETAVCFTIATLTRDGADLYAGRLPLPEGLRRPLAGALS